MPQITVHSNLTIFNEHTCWQIVGKDSAINFDNRAPSRLSLAEEDEIWSDVGEEVWPDVGEVWSDEEELGKPPKLVPYNKGKQYNTVPLNVKIAELGQLQ